MSTGTVMETVDITNTGAPKEDVVTANPVTAVTVDEVYEDVQDYVHPTVRMPPNPYCDRSMQFATVLGWFALAGFIGIGYWGSQH